MKIITIFNFPNEDNYNKLCQWWLKQALANSDLPIEIWYEHNIDHLNVSHERVTKIQKSSIDISNILSKSLVSEKAQHNVGFKLYNLCKETEPFIFIDADAILLKNIKPLIDASYDKPIIMVNHQKIQGHTAQFLFKFLNSGVQVVGDPQLLDFNDIVYFQNQVRDFVCPGTDQAMLWNYFVQKKYDYTHPDVGFMWNNCAGLDVPLSDICINHYWYKFKPWNINCPLWKEYLGENK